MLLSKEVMKIHCVEERGGINLVKDKTGISVQITKNMSDIKHPTSMFIMQHERNWTDKKII